MPHKFIENFKLLIYIDTKCLKNSLTGLALHRNRAGLVDTHNLLQGTDDRTIVPLLLKHQIAQILLFDGYDRYYDLSPANRDKLYYRLIKRENIPSYLEEIPSPLNNARHYRVRI